MLELVHQCALGSVFRHALRPADLELGSTQTISSLQKSTRAGTLFIQRKFGLLKISSPDCATQKSTRAGTLFNGETHSSLRSALACFELDTTTIR